MYVTMQGIEPERRAAPAAAHPVETMWDGLLALGMLLSLETQLRPGGASVGPGEALLALWIGPIAVAELARVRPRAPRQAWDLLRFWAIMAAALSVGFIATVVRAVPDDWSLVAHDVAAYAMLAVLTLLIAVRPDATLRLHRLLAMVVAFGAVLLLLQLANAQGLFGLPNVDPWYWDRMRGWADNPNQFALLCLLIAFLSVALVGAGRTAATKALACVGAAIGLGTGFLAKSNAFPAVVAAAFLVVVLLKAARALRRAERNGFPAAAAIGAFVALAVFAGCLVAPIDGPRVGALRVLDGLGRKDKSNDEEAELRLALWKQAIERGLAAYGFGLGPGPHLDIPGSILAGRRDSAEPINLSHPKPGLAPNFESHNTFLELFLQGGVIGVCGFLWIGATAAVRALRSGFDGLVGLLTAIAAFGSFHVVFRHPLVWLAIVLALCARSREAASAAADVLGLRRRTGMSP